MINLQKSQMSSRERFMAAIRREQPDRVPMFDFLFQEGLYESLIGRRPGSYNSKDALELAHILEHDAVWVPFGGFQGYEPEWLDKNKYRDEWGTVLVKSDASWPVDSPVDHPIRTRDDLKDYKAPDPTLPGRISDIEWAVRNNSHNLAITGGIQGPLTTAWLLMGFEDICFNLYDDPELVEEVFRISNTFFKEAARRSVEAGVDAMWISEDLGDSNSVFFQKDMYRKHIYPYLVEIVDYVHSLGVPALLHSCGNITQYLDLISDTKIASIHPMQRTAGMDLGTMKKDYGERFCLIGNIDSSGTLPYGTEEDVRRETKEAIEAASRGGGFVLASDHSLHDGISVENILAMRDACLKHGSYNDLEEP